MNEKKYEEVVKKLQEALAPTKEGYEIAGLTRRCLEEIFPELRESEDEKVRKSLIALVTWAKSYSASGVTREDAETMLNWLEKQAEQKTTIIIPKFKVGDKIRRKAPRLYDKDMQVARIERDYYICNHIGKFSSEPISFSEESNYELVEQEPADKIEPMFRIGDWVVNNDSGVIQHIKEIVNVNDETLYVFDEDSVLDINFQEQYHLWTIRDAKDGDVLVCNDYPFLFSKYEIDEYGPVCCSYCGISNSDYGEFLINTNTKKYWCDIEFVNPATKEQRELLFQKMKEAGYMWDADKKKVVKCVIDEGKAEMDYCFTKMMNGEKVSSAWSEEDEKMIRGLIVICDEWTIRHSFYPIENCEMEKLKKWLESLKDRVGCEANLTTTKEWSEEDEHRVKDTIYFLDTAKKHYASTVELDACIDWLKSLKPQKQWKPSGDQMKALEWALSLAKNCGEESAFDLRTLHKDLKKLTE